MRKMFVLFLLIFLVVAVSCKKVEQKGPSTTETSKAATTGDAVVNTVGNDLNNVDSIEKDLATDDLSDLDSTLKDIENIQ